MVIATQQSEQIFLGNGVTTAFDFSFVPDSAADIIVSYTDEDNNVTVLTPSQYTLFLNPAATGQIWGVGGTVTYPTVGSPIADGTSLTVQRVLPLTQITSISNQGDFSPIVIESALDTLEMQIQQVAARTGAFRGTWATNTLYNFGDYVVDGVNGSDSLNYYSCVIANTSGVWATDLASGYWTLVININGVANYAIAAAASADASAASAVVSTTQAGISTTGAATSTTQAGIATTQASIATAAATSAAYSAAVAGSFGSTLKGTSTTSLAVGTGSKSFTTQAGLTFVTGGFIVAVDQGNSANYMHGQVVSYSGTSLVMNVTDIGGSGTHAAWNILLSGTQGTTGATGPGVAAGGTTAQVLSKINGTDYNTQWITLPPGTLVLITTQTVSSPVATVDFTSGISSTYKRYIIEITNAIPSSSTYFTMRFSTDGGGSWKAGGSDYSHAEFTILNDSTTTAGVTSTADSKIVLSGGSPGTSASSGLSFTINFTDPSSLTVLPRAYWNGLSSDSATAAQTSNAVFGAGAYLTAGEINGIRFLFNAGNITAGTFKLYGVL